MNWLKFVLPAPYMTIASVNAADVTPLKLSILVETPWNATAGRPFVALARRTGRCAEAGCVACAAREERSFH
jgi:hypothetical protein